MSTQETTGTIEFAVVRPDLSLEIHRGEEWLTAFARDVSEGLLSDRPWLAPKYFYDARGSELFDQICMLPEYYPTRTEESILSEHGAEIIATSGASGLVELGSGSSQKTEHLLRPLLEREGDVLYVPVDFSEAAIREAAVRLVGEHAGLRVHGVIGDFEKHLEGVSSPGPQLYAFLGGTIGNFSEQRRRLFLRRLATLMNADDTLLVGIDLVKDRAQMEAAYDDDAGVTADFNRNVLASINKNLGGGFELAAWDHVAFFDEENSWIEMRLRANCDQTVAIKAIGAELEFAAGDEIRTETSRKFTREGFAADLRVSGFELRDWYTDRNGWFALALAAPVR